MIKNCLVRELHGKNCRQTTTILKNYTKIFTESVFRFFRLKNGKTPSHVLQTARWRVN